MPPFKPAPGALVDDAGEVTTDVRPPCGTVPQHGPPQSAAAPRFLSDQPNWRQSFASMACFCAKPMTWATTRPPLNSNSVGTLAIP